MKKLATILLCLFLCGTCFFAFGCNNDNEKNKDDSSPISADRENGQEWDENWG